METRARARATSTSASTEVSRTRAGMAAQSGVINTLSLNGASDGAVFERGEYALVSEHDIT